MVRTTAFLDTLRTRLADPSKPWRRENIAGPVPPEILARIARPATFAPATAAELAEAELGLTFELPDILQRVYLIANGGFGPATGLLGLGARGFSAFDGKDLVATYLEFNKPVPVEQAAYAWISGMLPAWDWGGNMWSCIDATTPDANIVTYDDRWMFTRTRFSLQDWLAEWLAGTSLFEEIFETADGETLNPFTRQRMPIRRVVRARGEPFQR